MVCLPHDLFLAFLGLFPALFSAAAQAPAEGQVVRRVGGFTMR